MCTNVDILVFGAHADDAEVGMGGTIAKHTTAGVKVGICDLTAAELSSSGTVELRKQEAEKSAKMLGLTYRSNLGLPDRGLERTQAHVAAITAEIRRARPRVVFAPYWEDRHPDHVACSNLVEEAIFNAKLCRYMPDVPPVTVEKLYYYFINDTGRMDLLVDVSKVYEQKLEAISCYRSQFGNASDDDTDNTLIHQGCIKWVKSRDALAGQRHAIPWAEGFAVKTAFVVDLFAQ